MNVGSKEQQTNERREKESANNPMYGKFGSDNHHSKHYWAISPDGTEYDFIGMEEFCRQHNLQSPNAIITAQGKHSNHKGWLFGYCDEAGNKLKTVYIPKNNSGNAKTYKFTDPFAKTHFVTGQFNHFCKANSISPKAARACLNGVKSSYKGWTISYA